MTKTTQDSTGKLYIVSWYQEPIGFQTPPILFRESEVAKVDLVLIYAGFENVSFQEVTQ